MTDADRCPNDGLVTMARSLLEEQPDPWIGALLQGKVRIEARIGRGGMGAVYRGRHLETGGPVAVKLLHAGLGNRSQAVRRFHLEAQNAAMLQSVHTIRVSDFGIVEGCPFLVMEYLGGLPLSAVLRAEGALPWRRAAHIANQVCKSLWEAHAHARRIIHRDIKPGNVFVLNQLGATDFVKVLDFGISRALESEGADTRGPIGTPHAMAPEQWRGVDVDGRADLYAVGCLLYEMLAGVPPFDVGPGATPSAAVAELARLHTHEVAPPLPADVIATMQPDLVALLRELLAKHPDARPASAAFVVARLDVILQGRDAVEGGARQVVGGAGSDRGSEDRATANWLIDALDAPRAQSGVDAGGSLSELTMDDANDVLAESVAMRAGAQADSAFADRAQAQGKGPVHAEPDAIGGAARPSRRGLWLAAGFGVVVAASVLGILLAMPPDEASLRASLVDGTLAPAARQSALTQLLDRTPNAVPRLRGLHLAELDLHDRVMHEVDLQGANLSGTDLQRADLTNADLRRASLEGANLRGCRLRGADLRGANLEGAVLAGTELAGSKFDEETRWPATFDAKTSGAVGPGANPGVVDLRGADLRRASLVEANLQGGQFGDANLSGASLRGANVRDADLSKASLHDADLRGTDLRGVDLRGADLRGAQLEGADLRGALYDRDTRWPDTFGHRGSGAVGPEAILRREDLSERDLRNADLRGADVRDARLLGTDLRGARLDNARFEGARFNGSTRWPDGFDAQGAGAVEVQAAAERTGARGETDVAVQADAQPGADAAPDVRPLLQFARPDAPPAPAVPRIPSLAAATSAPAAEPRTTAPASAPGRAAPQVVPAASARGDAAVGAGSSTQPPTTAPTPALPPAGAHVGASGSELRPPPALHPQFGFQGADLRGCDLSGVALGGVSLRKARFDGRTRWPAGFDPATSGAFGPGVNLRAASLRGQAIVAVDLRGADLRDADLRDCRFAGSRLERAKLDRAQLQGADLAGARLDGATLDGATFDGSTRWPSGFEPTDHGATLGF